MPMYPQPLLWPHGLLKPTNTTRRKNAGHCGRIVDKSFCGPLITVAEVNDLVQLLIAMAFLDCLKPDLFAVVWWFAFESFRRKVTQPAIFQTFLCENGSSRRFLVDDSNQFWNVKIAALFKFSFFNTWEKFQSECKHSCCSSWRTVSNYRVKWYKGIWNCWKS